MLKMWRLSVSVLATVAFLLQGEVQAKAPLIQLTDRAESIAVENGYVRLVFDKRAEAVSALQADFSGASDFKVDVLARPFRLTTVFENVTRTKGCVSERGSEGVGKGASYSVVTQSDELVEFVVKGIKDCADSPVAEEVWHISLRRSERFAQIRIEGGIVASASGESVVSIGHTVYTKALSLYGLFDRGAMQMMNNPGKCMGSDQSVDRLYALGNDQSIDVLYREYPSSTEASSDNHNIDVERKSKHMPGPAEVVFLSQFEGATTSVDTYYGSGFQDVLVGAYPRKSLGMYLLS